MVIEFHVAKRLLVATGCICVACGSDSPSNGGSSTSGAATGSSGSGSSTSSGGSTSGSASGGQAAASFSGKIDGAPFSANRGLYFYNSAKPGTGRIDIASTSATCAAPSPNEYPRVRINVPWLAGPEADLSVSNADVRSGKILVAVITKASDGGLTVQQSLAGTIQVLSAPSTVGAIGRLRVTAAGDSVTIGGGKMVGDFSLSGEVDVEICSVQ